MNNKKRLSKGQIALIVVAAVVLLVAMFLIIVGILNVAFRNDNLKYIENNINAVEYEDQLTPVYEDGYWTFTTDEEFKVLHLTDIHIGGGWLTKTKDYKAINAVANMVTAEKPDLVIITGDLVYPVGFAGCTFNNKEEVRLVATLMEKLGVYWTVTFGNHDSEWYSFYDRQAIADYYCDDCWTKCIFEDDDGIYGCGNSVIKIKNSQGLVTQALFTMDSNAYMSDKPSDAILAVFNSSYDTFHDDQIAWYREEVQKIHSENQAVQSDCEMFKSLLFFHIPMIEMRYAYNEYLEAGCTDTENVQWLYGVVEESDPYVYSSPKDTDMFETILELGSTQGMFFGHDHINNMALTYKGINMEYGMSVDYLAYAGIDKVGKQRGCKVITVYPDGSYSSVNNNYYQEKYDIYPREVVCMD
ncbi:MAG: metallophosphoesterase family protein [Christensenellales bacterium]